ncbi:hypothetical protein DFJ74DRAFT_757335 [Hyaloraphidium curvatum]|nr:hypothetical protein DFJ74DRAFT_757335 [Hyaloraphidium curvatum]
MAELTAADVRQETDASQPDEHASAADPAEEWTDEPFAALPADIMLLLGELLLSSFQRRSLLNLLSTCRTMMELGMGILVRELDVTDEPRRRWDATALQFVDEQGDGPGDFLDKFRGLLADGLGLGKLRMVRKLSVGMSCADPFFAALLAGVGPSLEELTIYASCTAGIMSFLGAAESIAALRRATINGIYDPERPAGDPKAAHFLPLLQRLDCLATFEALSLFDPVDDGPPPGTAPGWLDWPSAIRRFPNVAARLDELELPASDSALWTLVPGAFPRARRLCFRSESPNRADLRAVLAAFPGLASLELAMHRTAILADGCWTALEELVLERCRLDLSPAAFGAVRAAAAASRTALRIEPDWDTMEGSWVDAEQVRAARAEEAFWAAQPRVEIPVRDGGWWEEALEGFESGSEWDGGSGGGGSGGETGSDEEGSGSEAGSDAG